MAGAIGQRTFSHLSKLKHVPGSYEISTTSLLYHVKQGFSINLPAKTWQDQHLGNTFLDTKDLEDFVDPRKTYYGRYVEEQREKELHLHRTFEKIESTDCLRDLSPEVLTKLAQFVPPLRYVFQCLQMTSSYLAQMSPTSRILIPFLLQSADEIRRVQSMSYLMGLFRRHVPDFGNDAQMVFENDPTYQPLRCVLEEMLATYDFSECLILLTRVAKPRIDFGLMTTLMEFCTKHDAPLLADVISATHDDCMWHKLWSDALMERLATNKEQCTWIDDYIHKWRTAVDDAVLILEQSLGTKSVRSLPCELSIVQ